MAPRAELTVKATGADGAVKTFTARSRIDTPEELNYFKNGGILPYVLRNLAQLGARETAELSSPAAASLF